LLLEEKTIQRKMDGNEINEKAGIYCFAMSGSIQG
jgi:hypothetical protein